MSKAADTAFEHYPVEATISFRDALAVVSEIASCTWIDGDYFCMKHAEILERAAKTIRDKVANSTRERVKQGG